MISVLHLLDRSAGWEQRVALSQLLDHLPGAQVRHTLLCLGSSPRELRRPLSQPVSSVPTLAVWPVLAAPLVARAASKCRADVIHAWGVDAALAARSAGDRPMVVELFDPGLRPREKNLLHTLGRSGRIAFTGAAQMVRRRLVECGVPDDRCVVIRPGVDFNVLGRARREPLRERLGLARDELVVTTPAPATVDGGQREAFLAACFAAAIRQGIRFVLPGDSPQARAIRRLAACMPAPCKPVFSDDSLPFEQVVAAADVLVVAPAGDASMTAVAWAFAAGAAVIAVADYTVTELVVARVNGLLLKRPEHESPALPIARLLLDAEAQRSVRETARGQAYQVFSVRRYVEQHLRLYDNLLAGARPENGISDSAIAG